MEIEILDWEKYKRSFSDLDCMQMRANFTQLYLHCVWATWDRLPLITPDIREIVHSAIARECTELGCTPIAVGGVMDHVHLLVNFPATLGISQLMKNVKGSSSHLIAHEVKPNHFFKWQGAYGAFTVSNCDLDRIADYIRNQETHHQQDSFIPTLELPTS